MALQLMTPTRNTMMWVCGCVYLDEMSMLMVPRVEKILGICYCKRINRFALEKNVSQPVRRHRQNNSSPRYQRWLARGHANFAERMAFYWSGWNYMGEIDDVVREERRGRAGGGRWALMAVYGCWLLLMDDGWRLWLWWWTQEIDGRHAGCRLGAYLLGVIFRLSGGWLMADGSWQRCFTFNVT